MAKTVNTPGHRQDGFFTQEFSQAVQDTDFVDELINWYIQVFNDRSSGEWAESWTPEQVRQKLIIDTAGQWYRSLITSWRHQGDLVGATIVFVERADRVLKRSDLPPGCQTDARLAEVNRHLDWLIGADPLVVQYRELGIVRQFRQGFAPVGKLIADSAAAAIARGARYGCWWTSRQSRLFPIVIGLDCRVAYDFQDDGGNVLMIGECDQTHRRLCQPPAKINQMLAERLKNLGLKK